MTDTFGLLRPTLPVAYAQLVFDIAAEKQISAEALLNKAQLPVDLLSQAANGYITPWQYTLLHIAAAQMLDEQGLGMELGLRMRPTAHGFLGYALLSCHNLLEAIQLSLRFMRIRQQHIQPELVQEEGKTIIRFKEIHSFGPVRHFFMEGMMIGMARSAQYLVDDLALPIEMWLDYPEPEYFSRYRDQLPYLRFDKPDVRLILDEKYFDRPLRLADPHASQQAIEACERELILLGDSELIISEVRVMFEEAIQNPPPLDAVAERMFMSTRSLKRKLKQHRSSYQLLLDDVRFKAAQRLLMNPRLKLQQVGELVGYCEPASFTRAFKKWAGVTPKSWRLEQVAMR